MRPSKRSNRTGAALVSLCVVVWTCGVRQAAQAQSGAELCVLLAVTQAPVIVEKGSSTAVRIGPDGTLLYAADARGNRLPDFSCAGYHSAEMAIPDIPVKFSLDPVEGDNTASIQKAIDDLGRLPQERHGSRGALLLKRGVYRVAGALRINQSGVVLRGEGNGLDGTVLIATGYGDSKYRRALMTVGNGGRIKVDEASKREITDDYVPVGTHRFTVQSVEGYKVGDRIAVYRPATAAWIKSIGCDTLKSKWETRDGQRVDRTKQWQPGEYDFYFERSITAIEGRRVTIDAPVMHAMEPAYGGGAIFHYDAPGRVTEVGIENLRLISEFADPVPGHPYGAPEETLRSENHGWHGIKLSLNTENTWVRDVTGHYFGWSVVSASGKRATVQDCVSLGHASKITGGRRYPFMIDGQLNLVQRCLTFEGRHEFVAQARTAGPNVFVDCIGKQSKSSSGPHHRYSIGTLFDNVASEKMMESRFRGNSGTGHGWAGTQTCFYNCIAPGFAVQAPPGGVSWVIGSGARGADAARVAPVGLYYQQVEERLGRAALAHLATARQRERLGTYDWVAERLRGETR